MIKKSVWLIAVAMTCSTAYGQKVDPKAYYVDIKGVAMESTSVSENVEAPLEVTFRANPSEMDDYTPSYEWHFWKQSQTEGNTKLFVRYEEDTQYTFTESGTFNVVLKTMLGPDLPGPDSVTIVVTIPASKLVFPNAFSPNDDEKNKIYGAKGVNDPDSPDHWKSIVSFHAWIFNRWGQKLFEWTDVSKGWDGTYHGTPVKEGVYYVLVKAKGSDGVEYNIRKDVNLLRRYSSKESGSSSTGE